MENYMGLIITSVLWLSILGLFGLVIYKVLKVIGQLLKGGLK